MSLLTVLLAFSLVFLDARAFSLIFFTGGVAAARFDVAPTVSCPAVLLWLGKISFSLYLSHQIVLSRSVHAVRAGGDCSLRCRYASGGVAAVLDGRATVRSICPGARFAGRSARWLDRSEAKRWLRCRGLVRRRATAESKVFWSFFQNFWSFFSKKDCLLSVRGRRCRHYQKASKRFFFEKKNQKLLSLEVRVGEACRSGVRFRQLP